MMDRMLTIAVAVLVIGAALVVNGLSKIGATGYASIAWGKVNITVRNTTDITLTVASVDLGQLGEGETNNTIGDQASDPAPFSIRNDGNIPINISLQGTSLFIQTPNPTANFQARCGNVTAEWNCTGGTYDYNTSAYRNASILSFTDIPASGSPRVFIANLTHRSAYDEAKLDISVTVPSEELGGIKGSTITFTSSACMCS